MNRIVGTAGHIDHGKTALVRALTGVDADRLPEEKRRGITIDLGFARLDLADLRLGFVDVPGHERFVKNMLAGASGIDLVALVVAADAGVMPQTREHFEICRLLGVSFGVIVITKIDLVDDELLELVRLDVAELVQNSFLEFAPIVLVSAKTLHGIEELKQTFVEIARKIPARTDEIVAQLPIDRFFSVKGFGTVVTGTLVAGEIREGAEMQLLPIERGVRVRSVQTNGETVNAASAGQRTAINLSGVEASEIERGMVLAPADSLRPTQIFDAEIEVLADAPRALKSRQRVRLHIGTIEVLARVQILEDTGEIALGERGLVQLRLESPIVAAPWQRFIIRSYSPQRTIAGGAVIDNAAARARGKNLLEIRSRLQKLIDAANRKDKFAQLLLVLETAAEHGLTKTDLTARTAWREQILSPLLIQAVEKKSIIAAGATFLARRWFEKLTEKTVAAINAFHKNEPLARGMSRETLREKIFAKLPHEVFRRVLLELEERKQISLEKDIVRQANHNQNLSDEDAKLRARLAQIYLAAKLEVPTLDQALTKAASNSQAHARKVFQLLLDSGELVRVTAEFYFHRETLAQLKQKLFDFARNNSSDATIDVAQFKNLAEISRKYAIPLLEYFDREAITRRAGDKRIVLNEKVDSKS